MQTFAEYCRTSVAFAHSIRDRDDWLVSAVSRGRDAEIVDESNFHCAVAQLGGESETLEIHRFGHWAVGWVEHIFVHPSRAEELEALETKIADYPILDEDDFSAREYETVLPAWQSYGQREWALLIAEAVGAGDAVADVLTHMDPEATLEWHLARGEASGLEFDGQGPTFNWTYVDTRYSYFRGHIARDEVAALVKLARTK